MRLNPERRFVRLAASVVTAASLFTTAFASPESVQSRNDRPKLTGVAGCLDEDGRRFYDPYVYPDMRGISALYLSYKDPVNMPNKERVMVVSGEGYKKFVSEPVKAESDEPTQFVKMLRVEPPANSDVVLRITVFESGEGLVGKPSAEITIKPADCSGLTRSI